VSTTLDELLSAGDESEPEPSLPRPDAVWWWLAKAVLWSTVLAFPIWALARSTGFGVPYPLVAMLLLEVRVLRGVLRWVDARPLPDSLTRPSADLVSADQAEASHRDGLVMAMRRWETRLSFVRLHGDRGAQFARTAQPQLVELIDERLRLRHGVVRAADPERARSVLGEPLWRFVTAPVRKNLSIREVSELISLMEAL
jgi:hypothetical protein